MNEMSVDRSVRRRVAEPPFIEVEDLRVTFRQPRRHGRAVNGLSFDLERGKVLCVIGESGSGKSVMMRSLLRLHPKKRTVIEGAMRVGEHDIAAVSDRAMIKLRGSLISMVFQEPMTALDPLYTVGRPDRGNRAAARERQPRGGLGARAGAARTCPRALA